MSDRRASERYDAAFFSKDELDLIEEFEERGYVITDVSDRAALDRIVKTVAEAFASGVGNSDATDLDSAHQHVEATDLNRVRLGVFHQLNSHDWLRPSYYRLATGPIHALIGNELAMQRRVNLSIQLPNDDSSLLGVHADAWSGDSPYELVVWLPLVDCHGTKSMYILPRQAHERHVATLASYRDQGSEELFAAIEPDLEWVDIKLGQVLIFSHTLMHGNRVNVEAETRWSLNCRFKSLLSPYDTKRVGEFFEPITVRAATRIGMTYAPPEGFE